MKTRDLAWAAGIIDGEGCFSSQISRWLVYFRIEVVNTDPRMVLELKRIFGGTVHPKRKAKGNWRPTWTWQVMGKTALEVARLVRPFLVCKQVQADIVIVAGAERRGRGGRGYRRTAGDEYMSLDFARQIKRANHFRPDGANLGLRVVHRDRSPERVDLPLEADERG
jgi:hypothetical protein